MTVRQVRFKNQFEVDVAGRLFVPNNLNRSSAHAAIIVGHPMGAVKEQGANLYAMKAIATVSMYDMGAASRQALNQSQTLAQRKAIIAEAAHQRDVEFTGGETKYTGGTVHEITEKSHSVLRCAAS